MYWKEIDRIILSGFVTSLIKGSSFIAVSFGLTRNFEQVIRCYIEEPMKIKSIGTFNID